MFHVATSGGTGDRTRVLHVLEESAPVNVREWNHRLEMIKSSVSHLLMALNTGLDVQATDKDGYDSEWRLFK